MKKGVRVVIVYDSARELCRAALIYLSHVMYNSVKISNIINKGLVKLYRKLNLTGKRLGVMIVYWSIGLLGS